MKIHPTLYSRDSHGKVRVWYIEQDGEKYRTVSGTQDGEKVTSEFTVCLGKNLGRSNETSPEQQAASEIKSKYTKQLKTGYTKNLEDVDTAVKYIEPILAKSYKDYADEVDLQSKQWGGQTKFNGVCCLASKNGCYSRKGEKFLSIVHIEKALAPFFDKYPNAVLHGELFNDDYREKLNEIVKLCRKTVHIEPSDFEKSEKLIRLYIYDGYFPDVNLAEHEAYNKRKAWLDENVIGKYDYCVKVETVVFGSKQELDRFYGEKVERGDEGIILRYMDMPYIHRRSKQLLKYKPLDSEEMELVNILPGAGNWSGKAKIITVKMKDGKVFDAVFKGNMVDAAKCLEEKDKWIGKIVTIVFNGKTGLGCPQYAQFDYNNCIRLD